MKRVTTPMGERARVLNGWRCVGKVWLVRTGAYVGAAMTTRAEARRAAEEKRAWHRTSPWERTVHPEPWRVVCVTRWARRRAG